MNGFALPNAGVPRAHVSTRAQTQQLRRTAQRTISRCAQRTSASHVSGDHVSAVKTLAASVRVAAGAALANAVLSVGAAHAQATEVVGTAPFPQKSDCKMWNLGWASQDWPRPPACNSEVYIAPFYATIQQYLGATQVL